MSDINLLPGERLSFFKLFSVKKCQVEIPIIQRDYAQGRESTIAVRTSFLDALESYLKDGEPNRDLDFVYGTLIKDQTPHRFIPLDGQQRLTTLFLLHWYLAQLANKAKFLKSVLSPTGKSLFSYETRTSSSEFCNALMAYELDLTNLVAVSDENNDGLSKTIQDCGWFHLSWMSDPTITSMLTMLDAIHTQFSGNPEYFDLLVDEVNPVITFLFLDLEEFKLTDDLYIKMNARGRPLTEFENFKAKFEQRVHDMQGELKQNYVLTFDSKPKEVNGYEYLVQKIDTHWADLFWIYRDELTRNETFDDEMMNFIRMIIANHSLLDQKASLPLTQRLDNLFGDVGKLNSLSFLEYQNLNCLNPDFVTQFIEIMDLLYGASATGEGIQRYVSDEYYYSQDQVFRKIISNDTNYTEKLRFFAFYKYLAEGKNKAGLTEWMRVIFNLTENTIINNSAHYAGLLLTISELGGEKENILDLLKNKSPFTGFEGAQVLEERIKAHLITKSEAWMSLIIGAEKHPFFKGQIGFALYFSGIVDFYRLNTHWDWDPEQNDKFFSDFKSYVEKGCKVFDLIKDSSADHDYLWERAVLSKGKYFTYVGDDKWNMLNTRSTRNNADRDHSWKRLLRIALGREAATWERSQSFVKAVFDDPDFVMDDVPASLKKITDKALLSLDAGDWRREFIQYKQLFGFSTQGSIYLGGTKILLLKGWKRNGYYGELYSKVLAIELQRQADKLKPFNNIDYKEDFGEHGRPRAFLDQWIYKEKSHYINIQFAASTYTLDFIVLDFEKCSKDLGVILEKHGFSLVDENQVFYYEGSCATLFETVEVLTSLCSDFQELESE